MGTAPSFYTDSREDLMARKFSGTDKQFDEKARRRVLHGREREDTHLRMLGKLLGYPTVPFHWLISNDKWPRLGATLDGVLLALPEVSVPACLDLTSNKIQVLEVIEALKDLRGPVLVELKNTDGGHRYKDKSGPTAGLRPWIDFSPGYHHEQVQTGMWLGGFEHGILSGSLGADDIGCWFHGKEEGWNKTLDLANRDAQAAFGALS